MHSLITNSCSTFLIIIFDNFVACRRTAEPGTRYRLFFVPIIYSFIRQNNKNVTCNAIYLTKRSHKPHSASIIIAFVGAVLPNTEPCNQFNLCFREHEALTISIINIVFALKLIFKLYL